MNNPNMAQPNSAERFAPQFHQHKEIAPLDTALDYAEAANNLNSQIEGGIGKVAIHALKNAGETATLANGKKKEVPEGQIQLSVSGTFDKHGTTPFYDEVKRIQAAKDEKAA